MPTNRSRPGPGESSLSPDLIAQRGFPSARRGFDPDHVKAFLAEVAEELRGMRQRCDALERALHDAEDRAAHPSLDENTLMAAVGDETARILRSAHTAAHDIKAKAENNASRILKEAHDRATAMLGDAEAVLAKRSAEAQAAADRITASGSAHAEQQRNAAHEDALAIRAQAEAERKLAIEAAHESRERILNDLSRRRHVAAVQVEQLRAGRERLLEAYKVVRRTLDEVTDDLQRADAEARAAADVAGRRLPPPHADEEVQGLGSGAGPSGLGGGTAASPGPGGDAALPAPVGGSRPSPEDMTERRMAPLRVLRRQKDAREGTERPAEAPRPLIGDGKAAGTGQAAPAPGHSGAVTDEDEVLLQRREELIGPVEAGLARKLKRALQDEQNDLLDRLRGLRVKPTAQQVLPTIDAHAERFLAAGRPFLEEAAEAGESYAASLSGRDRSTEGAGTPGIDDLAADLARAVVDPLRRRLEQAFGDGGGDDPAVLVESLGAAYREWKTQRVEHTAADHIAAAFARGVFAATPDGGRLRWLVEDANGPCPDCDDNALAGALTKGEPFPTGQRWPPAHAGCRCLLVPESP